MQINVNQNKNKNKNNDTEISSQRNPQLMKVGGWRWATSWPVLFLWAAMSVGLAVASFASLLTPMWFINVAHTPTVSFGVWAWCVGGPGEEQCSPLDQAVGVYEPRTSPALWSVVGALYGGGGALLALTGLATLLTPLMPAGGSRLSLTQLTSNIQASAVTLQAIALIIYPAGLGSTFASVYCSSSSYRPGNCHLGYAYMLALVCTGLAAYCPVLARLSTYKDYTDYWSNLNYL